MLRNNNLDGYILVLQSGTFIESPPTTPNNKPDVSKGPASGMKGVKDPKLIVKMQVQREKAEVFMP